MTSRPSVSGRAVNLLMRRMRPLAKVMTRQSIKKFDGSGGTKGATMRGKPIFRLTVVGRKSGEPRSVMLMLVRRGDDLLVCGSQGGTEDSPNWWKNLVAAGKANVRVGTETYDVTARVVTDATERAEAWALLTAAYPDYASYQLMTDRVLPIAVLTRVA